MNRIFTKLRMPGTWAFRLAVILLIVVIGTCSIVGPMHIARAKKRAEPEVTFHAYNNFSRTLKVVGDMDYKPFSYFHANEAEPHGYDIEAVAVLANRMGVNLDLQLMDWSDAVDQMQKKKADLILGCDWQDASVLDCNFTIPTFEEKFVAFELEPSTSFSDL